MGAASFSGQPAPPRFNRAMRKRAGKLYRVGFVVVSTLVPCETFALCR